MKLNRFCSAVVMFSLLWGSGSLRVVCQDVPSTTQGADWELRARAVQLYEEALRLYQSENVRGAIEKLLQAEPLFRRANDHRGTATALNALGTAYTDLDEPEKGLPYLREALAIRNGVGDVAAAAITSKALGAAYDGMGQPQQALDYYNQARRTFKERGDTGREARTLYQIALVYDHLNLKQKALLYCYNALRLIQDADPAQAAQNYMLIGTLYSDLGLFTQAHESFAKNLAYLRRPGIERSQEGIALVQGFMGITYARSGDVPKAIELFTQARGTFHDIKDTAGEASALVHIGSMYERQGQGQQALENYNQALQIVNGGEHRAIRANVLNSLGRVHRALGQNERALEILNQALLVRRELGDQLGQADTLYNIGATLEANNNPGRALGTYREAIALVEKVRTSTVIEELRVKVTSETANLYRRAVSLLLRARQPAEAFNLSEQARARAFLDQVGNASLAVLKPSDPKLAGEWQKQLRELSRLQKKLREENAKPAPLRSAEVIASLQEQVASRQLVYEGLLRSLKRMNPEYASFQEVDTQTLPQVQALLDRQTTLVSYFVSMDRVIAFVVGSNSFKAVELPVTESELRAGLTSFALSFENLSSQPTAVLKQLNSQLISPLEPYIATPLVGIVPHGILHYVPFAALFDGQKYLVEKHSLFSLPSASVFKFIQEKRKPSGGSILSLSQGRAEGLPFLRFADQTAQRVAGLYGKPALAGSSATEAALRSSAGESDILFIAAHGKLNSYSPMFSQIILAPDQENDGVLEVHEVYELELKKTNLVVLSACQTQLGEQSKGDDVVGLNRAFIYAGAPSVVASLWSVKEEQTGTLMYSFLKNYHDGMSKASALQAAQRELRATHPYYWAAFVLTGDPGK
jgi:CHAT domain-containing protein